ncbi:MAG: hypothetical protein AAGN66_21860 [Acidobacteriota bacterium]
MNDQDRDELLWEAGRRLEGADEPPTADGAGPGPAVPEASTLAAYRRGDLDPAAAEAVERALADSAEARAALARAAGLGEAPPGHLRRRVLEAFDAERRGSSVVPFGRPSPRRVRAWWGLAAAAVLALAVFWGRSPVPSLPPDFAYELTVQGLATERGGEDSGAALEAYTDTLVVLGAMPNVAVEDLEVGFYRRLDGDALERLRLPADRIASERGATRIEATGGELLGTVPATGTLFVVLARSGDLPEAASIDAADPEADLAADGRRRVRSVRFRLLPR